MRGAFTKLGEVWLTVPRAEGIVSNGVTWARLSVGSINDIAYVRDASRTWTEWAAAKTGSSSIFNWVAVYNFWRLPNCQAYALQIDDRPQALMLLRHDHIVRCDPLHRQPVTYIAFLEVAPWNRAGSGDRVVIGSGQAMLRVACDLSVQYHCDGRLGLHSLRTAEGFYRKLGFQALDCPNEFHEVYFELDAAGAQALLGE